MQGIRSKTDIISHSTVTNSKFKISLPQRGKGDHEVVDEVFFKETILEFFVRYVPDCPKKIVGACIARPRDV